MEQTTAHRELEAIRALMAHSQGLLTGTWPHQLVWGAIGFMGLLATWWGVTTENPTAIAWAWGLALVAGWTFSIRLGRAGARRARVRNVATRAFGGIWLGLGVTLTLLATTSMVTGVVDPRSLPGIIALVFGSGYYASGFVSGLRWLTRVGIAWWAGGVALLFMEGPGTLLALALMTLLLEVGPSLVLRRLEAPGVTRD